MLLITKINRLSKELNTHACRLTQNDPCVCIDWRVQLDKWLRQFAVESGLDPELIGENQGSTEPF